MKNPEGTSFSQKRDNDEYYDNFAQSIVHN